jgi:hypothetical protein
VTDSRTTSDATAFRPLDDPGEQPDPPRDAGPFLSLGASDAAMCVGDVCFLPATDETAGNDRDD